MKTRNIYIIFSFLFFCGNTFGQTGWYSVSPLWGSTVTFSSVDFVDSNTVYVTMSGGRIYKSVNAGSSWTYVNMGTQYSLSSIDCINRDTVFVGGAIEITGLHYSIVLRSTDQGYSWQQIYQSSNTNSYFTEIYFINSLTGWAAGAVGTNGNGMVYKTTDGGFTWSGYNCGYNTIFTSVHFVNNNTGWVVSNFIEQQGFKPGIFKSINGGLNWSFQNSPYIATMPMDVFFIDVNHGWLSVQGQSLRTTNSGVNWIDNNVITQNTIFFIDNNIGWCDAYSDTGRIKITLNGGITWKPQITPINYNPYINDIKFVNPRIGFACGSSGTIFKTTTGGELPLNTAPTLSLPVNGDTNFRVTGILVWNAVANVLGYNVQVASDSLFNNRVVDTTGITGTRDTLKLSILNYNTTYFWRVSAYNLAGSGPWSVVWKFKTSRFPPSPLLVTPANGSRLTTITPTMRWQNLLVNSYRIQIATNNTFNTIVFDSSGIINDSVKVPLGSLDSNILYSWRVNANNVNGAGPWSSIWYFYTPAPIGIIKLGNETPLTFSMFQNYPNPFNPVTSIRFDIPRTSFAKIIIYNVLGREISTLLNEELRAGEYSIDWNAESYPSGVYFYRLVTGEFTETKKMVFVK